MAFSKKTWKDRISQYINRRLLTDSDGNTQQVTVTRDEGSVTEAGDAFSAANMNDLEDRIDAAFDGLTAADIPYSQGVSVADKLDSLTPTYTGISTVSDTVVNATNKDIYTTHLNKGIYIINVSVLWKTSGTAQGLGIYIYSDNSMVAQDLEYTVGWCVQNLNVTVNIPTDNTEIIVRLYQTTGSNIAVEFNGNITKL